MANYTVTMFHGGSIKQNDILKGYTPKKNNKDRCVNGVGLYLTSRYERALNYSRSIKEITVNLNPENALQNQSFITEILIDFLEKTYPKKIVNLFKETFKNKTVVKGSQFEIFLLNNYNKNHLRASELNQFYIDNGVKYSFEVFNGYELRIFDFSIIKTIDKPKQYNASYIPNDLKKDLKIF